MKRSRLFSFIAILVLLIVAIALMIRSPAPKERIGFQVVSLQQVSSNTFRAALLLTNQTGRMLNIVDASEGGPAFIIESSSGSSVWLGHLSNSLALNLPSHGSLQASALITNAPKEFRLKFPIRDFTAERKVWSAYNYLPKPVAARVVEWRRKTWSLDPPTSRWIRTDE
jgi:hypothetical protein